MEQRRKIMAQGVLPAVAAAGNLGETASEFLPSIIKMKDGLNNTAGEDENGNNAMDTQQGPIDQMLNTQRQGEAGFGVQGLSPEDYNSAMEQLKSAGMPQTQVPSFLQSLSQIASQCFENVMGLMPLATAVARRYPGNYNQILQNLQIIGDSESKVPGLGLFQTALAAAEGQPFAERLNAQCMTLQAKSGSLDMKEFAQVELRKAIGGQILPESQFMAERDRYNTQRMKTLQQQQGLTIDTIKIKTIWDQEEQKYLADKYKEWDQDLPGFANGKIGRFLLGFLETIAATSAQYGTVKGMLGLGKNPGILGRPQNQQPSNQGFMGGKSAASLNFADVAVRLAQISGTAPANLSDTTNTSAPTANQLNSASGAANAVVNQSLNSQTAPNQANTTQVNTQTSGQLNTCQVLFNAFTLQDDNLKKKYQALTSLLLVGQGNAKLPYLSSPDVKSKAVELSRIASDAFSSLKRYQAVYTALPQQDQMTFNQKPSSADQIARAGVQDMLALITQKLSEATEMRLVTYQLAVNADIDQKLAMNQQYIDWYDGQMGSTEDTGGVGKAQYVVPYTKVLKQAATLCQRAVKEFMMTANSTREPSMKQFCLANARQRQIQAQGFLNKELHLVAQMAGTESGGIGNKTSDSITLSKSAPKLLRVADSKLEDYYNDLYKGAIGSPEYGTALEHPVENEGIPTCKIKVHHKFKRVVVNDHTHKGCGLQQTLEP